MRDVDWTQVAVFGSWFLIAGVLVAREVVRERRARYRASQAQRAVLEALAAHFGLAFTDPMHLEGRVGPRQVRVAATHPKSIDADVELTREALPFDVRIVQFDDGPYQKKEELAGGASPTGDAEFDARFLVYGTEDDARSLSEDLRARLLEHPMPHLVLEAWRLMRPLSVDPAAAGAELDALVRLAEKIDVVQAGHGR